MEICTDSLDLYVYLDLSFYLDNIKNNNFYNNQEQTQTIEEPESDLYI